MGRIIWLNEGESSVGDNGADSVDAIHNSLRGRRSTDTRDSHVKCMWNDQNSHQVPAASKHARFLDFVAHIWCLSYYKSVTLLKKYTKQTHLLALKRGALWRTTFPAGPFRRGSKCSVIASNQRRWRETNVSPSGKKYK